MARGRRRIWRKLHLGVDEKTKDIVAVDLTTSAVHDSPHMPELLGLEAFHAERLDDADPGKRFLQQRRDIAEPFLRISTGTAHPTAEPCDDAHERRSHNQNRYLDMMTRWSTRRST